MDTLQQWLARKTSRYSRLKEPATASHTFHKIAGPHSLFGQVTLVAQPAETFSFASHVTWPLQVNYDSYVLDGILDTLVMCEHMPVLGAQFTLESIEWHEINSVPIGYYYAAKEAARKILRLDETHSNIVWGYSL